MSMQWHSVKIEIHIGFDNAPSAVVTNRDQLCAATRELDAQLAKLRALEAQNQALCTHPKADLQSVLTTNTDGYMICTRCDKDFGY